MSLARLRRLKGFSQRSLAKEAGMSSSTIYEIEAGRHSPNPSTLIKLATALGVTTEEVLEAVEAPKAEAPSLEKYTSQVTGKVWRRRLKGIEGIEAEVEEAAETLGPDDPDVRETIERLERARLELQEALKGRAVKVRRRTEIM